MDKLVYLLPILACPIAMGAMMWLMMRGNHTRAPQTDTATAEEITALRADQPGQHTTSTGASA